MGFEGRTGQPLPQPQGHHRNQRGRGWIQFPTKLTPLLPPLPADSSVNMAGFSQFRFLFAFNLVPLLEESLRWSNRKTCAWRYLPLTRS